jgi:acyl phosphate:glycerol-3-phosphate acyltransferase
LFWAEIVTVLLAYLLGSIPTALIVSKRLNGVDIREIGDGNMGASNTFHSLGAKYGILVAVIDFIKGSLAIIVAQLTGVTIIWQFITGVSVIIGHDFPIFAHFKGGQGTATALGTMLVLFPFQAAIGLALYGILFLIIKKSSLSCAIGSALTVILLCISFQWPQVVYSVLVFLMIPLKKAMDATRRKAIQGAKTIIN